MKIKELHIRNIASIEKADINFESGLDDKITGAPASIFLISGDTGTGKSVILDAIAMALYKNTPRLTSVANKRENEFTDDQGNEVSIYSIEQYTRLGISPNDDCYSEVVFEGNDGKEYHARLTLGLTRMKAKDENGNYRIRHSAPVWSVKVGNDDWKKVEKGGQPILGAVGLSFDQFGRMAMLAQGQFASFLVGDKKERESILEQLTNTEHFSKYGLVISDLYKRAKEGYEKAKVAFDTEKEHTLPPETVDEYQRQLGELQREEDALYKEINSLETRIKSVEQLGQHRASRTKALERKSSLEQEKQSDDYKDKETLLKDWDATVTERQRVDDMKSARKDLLKAQEEEAELRRELQTLVADLDARKSTLALNLSEMERENAWLTERAERDGLYMAHGEAMQKLKQVKENKERLEKTRKVREKEEGKHEELQQIATVKKTKSETAAKTVREKQTEIDAVMLRIQTFKPEETRERAVAVTQEIYRLRNIGDRIIKHKEKADIEAHDRAEVQTAEKELELLKEVMEKDRLTFEEVRKKSEEANARLSTMSESLEETLVNLRKRLIKEEAKHCPLCGQKLETIYAEKDFREILTPIEQEQQSLAKSSKEAEIRYNQSKSKHDTSVGVLAIKRQQLSNLSEEIAKEKKGLRRDLRMKIDENFDADTLLADTKRRIVCKEEEEKKLQQQQRMIDELRSTLDSLHEEKRKLDVAKSEADKERTDAENELKNNEAAINRLIQEINEINEGLAQLSSSLSRQMGAFYPDWETAVSDTIETFRADATQYQCKKRAAEEQRHRIEKMQALIEALSMQCQKVFAEYPDCGTTDKPKGIDCNDNAIQVRWSQLVSNVSSLKAQMKSHSEVIRHCHETLSRYYAGSGKDESYLVTLSGRRQELDGARRYTTSVNENLKSCTDAIETAERGIVAEMEKLGITDETQIPDKGMLLTSKNQLVAKKDEVVGKKGSVKQQLEANNKNIEKLERAEQALAAAMKQHQRWELINRYFGGTRFRTLVQTYVLRPLLNNANIYLEKITDRYKLTCSDDNAQLSILVHDLYNKGNVRSATILSGGERFMISLALSLALSSLNRPDMNVDILFIDEGFGTLDEKNLDSVMSTLEKLQEIAGQSNRRVGIISHREELNERIPVQIQVKRRGEERSVVEVIKN